MQKQYSIGFQLMILVLSVFFCLLLASLVNMVIATTLFKMPLESIDLTNPKMYLLAGFLSQLVGFFGGFLLFLKLTKNSFSSLIQIQYPNIKTIVIVVALLILTYPALILLSYVNSFLADWIPNNYFIEMENQSDIQQNSVLSTPGGIYLTLKLIVIAVLPAIAEELIFRGVLLSKIKEASQNEHYAVLVSAIFFAALHFQPTKLLPMIFLGMVMGYIYTRTKNITYSMLFHFLFNGLTLLGMHYYPEVMA